eukprot:Lithocolla_globosa_v1_NODE_3676_length_1609_cov_4.326255.p1 type:complete len:275 gc:universal NODE_3676_length_1609_cov_4.326255:888-64(-)
MSTSAFAGMFGRELNDLRDYSEEAAASPMTEEQVKERLDLAMNIVVPAMEERRATANTKRNSKLDAKRLLTPQRFPTGATVWVHNHSRSKKLEARYEGPYKVVRTTRGGSYVLQDATNELLARNVAPNHLKMGSAATPFGESHVVEAVVDHRGPVRARQYKVRWRGFSSADDTWEHAEAFDDEETLAEYWRRRNGGKSDATKGGPLQAKAASVLALRSRKGWIFKPIIGTCRVNAVDVPVVARKGDPDRGKVMYLRPSSFSWDDQAPAGAWFTY